MQSALQGRPLDVIVNTHLHSDHAGGNAALQLAYPAVRTHIPPGQAAQVTRWDPVALFYVPAGQQCPPFKFDALLQPGSSNTLGGMQWQAHAAPGHDPHSLVLFEPASRTLISADALWQNGFGVVFPEVEGEQAFAAVEATLDVMQALQPRVVVPGHGSVFSGEQAVAQAFARARSRLAQFVADPVKHARHAAKVLLKFKLLEFQTLAEAQMLAWAEATPYFELLHQRYFSAVPRAAWMDSLLAELAGAGALTRHAGRLENR